MKCQCCQSWCGLESPPAVTLASSWTLMAQQQTAARTKTSGRTCDWRSAPKPATEEVRPMSCAPFESSKKDNRDTDDQERKQALVERECRFIKSKQNGKQTKLYFESRPWSATSRQSRSQVGVSPDLGKCGRKTCQAD